MDRVLTTKLKSFILESGMDIVGFAPVERWTEVPFLLTPQAILPDSKNVIVAGIHITDTWTEMGGEPNPQDVGPGGMLDINSLLDHVAYRTSKLLEEYGYKAVPIASSNIWRYRQFPGVPRVFSPDLSHIHASVAAGLTQIGWTGLAISPEFGPRVRYVSIVTDAELVPTPMYDKSQLCDMCMDCVRACPTAALRKDFITKDPVITHIGGKEFRYANKNIWRCAWAEHFDLDLDSAALKQHDHIGEKEILDELALHGERGHERGVCQKVCIPSHLRSDEPSFGREDKKLTMKRINRRYPDTMPTLRKLRDDFIAKAVSMGIDNIGVTKIDPESDVYKLVNIEAPGMTTAIGLVMQIPEESRDMIASDNTYVSAPYDYASYIRIHHIGIVMARWLEDMGYHASVYTSRITSDTSIEFSLEELEGHGNYESDHTTRFSGKQLAALPLCKQAGLGDYEGSVFTSPEFGTACLVAAVVTDAPLDEDKPQAGSLSKPTRKLNEKQLRQRLESIASEENITAVGVSPAERIEKIYDALKPNVNEAELGVGIHDISGNWHGEYVPEIYDDGNRLRKPADYMEDAQSVIVLSMHCPDYLVRGSGNEDTKQIGTYAFYTYQTAFELRFSALKLATELNRNGYKTVITENLLGIGSFTDSPRGLLPDMRCGALEGAAAGLGGIGKNGALMTKEHGAQQRQITIITNAKLPYDEVSLVKGVCDGCNECISACPMKAITENSFPVPVGEETVDYPVVCRANCDWSKRYSLCPEEGPALIGCMTDEKPPHDGPLSYDELCEACKGKDAVMKTRTVILEPCLRHCPYCGETQK